MNIRTFFRGAPFLAVVIGSGAALGAENSAAPEPGDLRTAGAVDFPVTCTPAVQAEFTRGVALLHSFFYEEARRIFTGVAEKDPTCAMAQWGIAMTWWHPIWTPPTPDEMKAGKAAIDKAMAMTGGTDRERQFIVALNSYYNTPDGPVTGEVGQSCHGPVGPRDRVTAYEKAMHKLYDKYPDDFEAQTFYALALMSVGFATPTDTTLANQLQAARYFGKVVEEEPESSGRRSLPDSLLRLSRARQARIGRCPKLQFHRTVGSSRLAHAVAYLHAPGHVGRVHRRKSLVR